MAASQDFPLGLGKTIGILAHDRARLRRKVRSRAHPHDRLDTLRLHRSHVQQDIASTADSESLARTDFQMVEQRQHVSGGIPMIEWFRQNAWPSVTTQVRHDELELCAP